MMITWETLTPNLTIMSKLMMSKMVQDENEDLEIWVSFILWRT